MTEEFWQLLAEILKAAIADLEAIRALYPSPFEDGCIEAAAKSAAERSNVAPN